MRSILSWYSIKLPDYLVYMLQQVEYDPNKFLEWTLRLLRCKKQISTVMYRKQLVKTRRVQLLRLFLYSLGTLMVISASFVFYSFQSPVIRSGIPFLIVFLLPVILTVSLYLLSLAAHKLIVVPQQNRLIAMSEAIFRQHKATKIAIIGSYGKTTMKELLASVLSEGKKIAVTPGNMNVPISHARFAKTLEGDEDVIIVEFGEGRPGDVERMAKTVHPDIAVVTGLAPNHLDQYHTLDDIAHDLLSIRDFVSAESLFITGESVMLQQHVKPSDILFTKARILDWSIIVEEITIHGVSFQMKNARKKLNLKSSLLGEHQVAPLALAAHLATRLGLSDEQIRIGVRNTRPFEHRMQPYQIAQAWVIDDTYNGNLEGLRAGLKLLDTLPAKRKWYVTPGLVDQGVETIKVHVELGKAIALAQPDIVVLMDNSVRPVIEKAMQEAGFKGELRVEKDPLQFYTNLDQILAEGDLMMLQNDWTDNYN